MLDKLDAALTGRGPADPEAEPLKAALAERGLSPRHALDLLDAFRMDATKLRYADWRELMHYCSLSAMPVGRFVLDVHGEDPQTTWPASDAICAALQVINHLQDCANDYKNLDRVYLPLDALAQHGSRVEDLARPTRERRPARRRSPNSPSARWSFSTTAPRSPISSPTRGSRCEIAAIRRLAVALASGLEASRSAVGESASRQGGLRADRARRGRRRARSAGHSSTARVRRASRRDARPLMAVAANHAPASAASEARRRFRPPAARSISACACCRVRGARRCMRSTPSAARSTTSPTTTGPREPRRAALDRWRADIDRLFEGKVTPATRRPRRADPRASSSGARIFRP